jgi:hypothetical protein
MRKFQYKFFILLSILTLGCQQKTKQKENGATVTSISDLIPTSDSLTIDLVGLQKQGQLKNCRQRPSIP